MIKKLKLVGFRSFENIDLEFEKNLNILIGDNGKGKTNILQAINLICNNLETSSSIENMVNNKSNSFFISAIFESDNGFETQIQMSYDKELKKKKIAINGKAVTKNKLLEYSPKIVYFSPIEMNLFYLGPSLRRNFLDNLLANSHPIYTKILKDYESIIKNRNKVLKNIGEGKSLKEEINFWNEKMINLAKEIYDYRLKLIKYFEENVSVFSEYFFGKIQKISFKYKTKTDLSNIENSIKKYLDDNLERDIILKKTQIGPHIDDFTIMLDGIEIVDFASRGETKSVIIGLKLLELKYLENITKSKPILLIDDFLSELDEKHKSILLKKIIAYQCIITTINDIGEINGNRFFL